MDTDDNIDKTLSKELTYKIIGCLYTVYNYAGFGHREKVYQRALEHELKLSHLFFKKEQSFPISYKGRIISRYFVDFVIESKIVVELKVGKEFLESYRKQALAYLNQSECKLAIIAVFTPDKVIIKRVII